MADLLRRPVAQTGRTHAITPESAGWGYVGFELWRLAPGECAQGRLEGREAILVLVEGRARLSAAGEEFGEMGGRMDVFERTPPHCLYVPAGADWAAQATTGCTLAVCTAPGSSQRPACRLGPEGIALEQRGEGANTRFIHNIAMEGRDVADSLLVTEVFTPAGNWSSYPPHRHDEDDFPAITYLEETYYHRLNPPDCFGMQRVFTDDLSLDETMAVSDQDVVLVPRGHHPCAAPYGVEMYYLNVMAGPRRNWRFRMHPAFAHMG
ncbi:5-deoxy-glucuronate isomerase [Pseudoruegeria aquimaris]|uniref:5-deoxy-glucuronate isomerase n=1 Tax=Pseudoruegeria aquimaris TaxID=393663 RepID=A0A1Y5RPI3_9RHOB|nr:5-deoxy-glucuronate isomerase [Pseudoruegeria aquimaris]SLN22473.1 5-deoxy-glucuronate isomerase [Pseudoruegeria aquimaris]